MSAGDATRIGTEFAGYRIEALLGRGGMSVVYLAEHVRLGRRVALKLLAPMLSDDDTYRDRFQRESRRAAELDHPNVVPIFDAGEAEGQLFIAMRYIEGCDLKVLIGRDGSLGMGRTLFILEQAADGLDAAHERNLIHRDVKPGNILIAEPSEHVYLTDFGVVKHTASRGLTRTGFFIGTVDYAAPEQIEGLPVDARTDVYALGCVLYECLVGKAPFDRDAEITVMHAHLIDAPPLLTAARPDLPKALNRVLASALAKSKDDRYDTCGQLIEAARVAALQRSTTSSHVPGRAGAGADADEAVLPAVAAEPPATTAGSALPAAPIAASVVAATVNGDSVERREAGQPPLGPPPEHPPASRGGGGRGGGRSWLAAGAIIVVAAALAAAAVFAAHAPLQLASREHDDHDLHDVHRVDRADRGLQDPREPDSTVDPQVLHLGTHRSPRRQSGDGELPVHRLKARQTQQAAHRLLRRRGSRAADLHPPRAPGAESQRVDHRLQDAGGQVQRDRAAGRGDVVARHGRRDGADGRPRRLLRRPDHR